ncbi:MAG TPA: alpha/beta hydrolase [Solirubrobacteraceae bacterium]|nr:alpha/beta hydrolase [Solirubrobacteraceae bacterium]
METLRTARGYAEAIGRLAAEPRVLLPFLRGGGTFLDEPRPPMPDGHVQEVAGSGHLFWRDTGPPPDRRRARGTILLLHGWMVPSDPHWFRTWRLLQVDGWRVIALDARGHGRGTRPMTPFRLDDCAEDAAALIRHLDPGPVVAVGYSMGGAIAQILALRHPELLRGVVLCATSSEFRSSPIMQAIWYSMSFFQLWLRLAPKWTWELFVEQLAQGDPATTAWVVGELRRGAPEDVAEAGRDIGRFDSRAWIADVTVPAAVVVCTMDLLVPPTMQRALAERLGAPTVEIQSDHLAPGTTPRRFHRGLSQALDLVEPADELSLRKAARRAAGG